MSTGSSIGSPAFTCQLFTALTSMILVVFYVFQLIANKKCNFHPVFVQSVTALVYLCASFGFSDFIWVDVIFEDGTINTIATGRYLFWIMTCPVILHGFIGLFHELGPPQDNNKTTMMVVQDIGLMVLGLLGALERPGWFKVTLIFTSFALGALLVYEILTTLWTRSAYFPQKMHIYMYASVTLFLASWAIFPALYLLGTPGFNLISTEADIIGHAFGDLLAKNVFGFLLWYFRFQIVYPYKASQEQHQDNTKIVPTQIGSFTKNTTMDDPSSASASTFDDVKWEHHVLVVDSCLANQRLLQYMLSSVKVNVTITCNVREARQYMSLGSMNDFSAVLVNMVDERLVPEELVTFKETFSSEPYFLPTLGYSFDPVRFHEMKSELEDHDLFHFMILHSFDENQIKSAIVDWYQHAQFWRKTTEKIQRINSKTHIVQSPISTTPRSPSRKNSGIFSFDGTVASSNLPMRTNSNSSLNSANSRRMMESQQQQQQQYCANGRCNRVSTIVCGNCAKPYCSKECQIHDWRFGAHRQDCNNMNQQLQPQ